MKKWLIILLIVSFLVLTACNEILGSIEELGCGVTSGKTQAHCYKDSANRQTDPSVCGKIQSLDDVGNAPKNQCYQDIAVTTKDTTVCEQIDNPDMYSTTEKSCKEVVVRVGGSASSSCRFDTDCAPKCEGDVYWKRGCDGQTNSCKNTFDTDCTDSKTTVGENTFPFKCSPTGCEKDTEAISSRMKVVTEDLKKLNGEAQRVNTVFLRANKNCINGLADVTNELIVSAAKDIGFPITSIADALTNYVEQGLKVALQNSFQEYNPKMPPDQFIILNCKLEKTMKETMAAIGKKQDELRQELKDLQSARDQ